MPAGARVDVVVVMMMQGMTVMEVMTAGKAPWLPAFITVIAAIIASRLEPESDRRVRTPGSPALGNFRQLLR